jgi:prolyl 4-hydroxylase
VFFAGVLYILAGAPLQDIFFSNKDAGSGEGVVHKRLENIVVPEKGLVCEKHGYKDVHVLSREPLVVYIEGFLSGEEAERVVELR